MLHWLNSLDKVLRGEITSPQAIRDGNIQLPLRGLCFVGLVLAMVYGGCMGTFAIFREVDPHVGSASDPYMQLLATTIKVPSLFFLTLTITFPSLYVFNALVGSRLTLQPLLRLLVASLGVNLAVLASLGPIVAFFSVSTTNYHFMLLFNVLVFAVAGMLGLLFLSQTLQRIAASMQAESSPDESRPDEASHGNSTLISGQTSQTPSPLDRVKGHVLGRHVKLVFACWVVVFGLVGAQMGWVLRPFLGDPTMAFTWFRDRDSNFFENIFETLAALGW